VKLRCARCDHRGGADLSFIWYSKQFVAPSGVQVVLRLCPDCQLAFKDERAQDRFLRQVLKDAE
jgi:hypothetical protein